MNRNYYLPYDTVRFLEMYRDALQRCDNLGLFLHKYAPAFVIGANDKKSEWLLKEFPNTPVQKVIAKHIDFALLEHARQRWLTMTKAANAHYMQGVLAWRMVVGLGGNAVLETDLTLHHLYGIPYIPGSALKGLTRSYVTTELAEYRSKKIETDHPTIKRIFGTQKEGGTVIFFDALPKGRIAFSVDIMNAHYPDYYANEKAPTNDQQPIPVTFLTVEHTAFEFAVAPRTPKNIEHDKDAQIAIAWLQAAMDYYGVGGKTNAGYGYFGEMKPVEYSKPKIVLPSAGKELLQEVRVLKDTTELQHRFQLEDASALLQYKEYKPTDIILVIGPDYPEARNWNKNEQRRCQVERIESREDGYVVYCKPVQSKKKKK